jgi:dihydrofolate reductase
MQREGETMASLVVGTFLTLDGVMQGPGGPDEDRAGGFAHGGWSVGFWDEPMGELMREATSKPFDMVLGRRTYDIMAAHWPHAPEEEGKVFNDARKHVASGTELTLDWQNSSRIEGDVAEGIASLKAQDGPELQVHGSGNLVQTRLRHGLVDRFWLWVFPVVVGAGKRLFADGTIPASLRLVEVTSSTTGVVIGTYEPAGELVAGSFALD